VGAKGDGLEMGLGLWIADRFEGTVLDVIHGVNICIFNCGYFHRTVNGSGLPPPTDAHPPPHVLRPRSLQANRNFACRNTEKDR
jgi:hypothetical protein